MLSRASLSHQVRIISDTIGQPFMLDVNLTSNEHNQRAKLLRNGIIVSLFNTLEQFLKERFYELSESLSGSAISFEQFPDDLRFLFTIKSINGLSAFLGRSSKQDKLALFDAHIPRVGNMRQSPPIFSQFGFGYGKSNIGEQDVAEVLKAFGVESPWIQMRDIAARAGLARPSLQDDFRAIGVMRNSAAHNVLTNVTTSDLQSAKDIVLAVALGFDLLLTSAVRAYCNHPSLSRIQATSKRPIIKLRFLDQHVGATWKERTEANTRYIKTHSNLAAGKSMALSRSALKGETVVIRSASLLPSEWLSPI